MNCREFESSWNELLDAEKSERQDPAAEAEAGAAGRIELERAVADHARSCPHCRRAQEHYETLRRALRAWCAAKVPLAGPSPGLVERVVAGVIPPPRRTVNRKLVASSLIGLAASILALWFSYQWPAPRQPRLLPGSGIPNSRRAGELARSRTPGLARDPGLALSDATAATWDLARTASEPATRFGLQVIEAATTANGLADSAADADPSAPAGTTSASLPLVFRLVAPSTSRTDLLQEVGDGLSEGVRPLSSVAREAFGFLRTPALDRNAGRTRRPSIKGA